MLVSAVGVYLLFNFIGINEVVIKIIVDALLFVVSFYVQREWVFKKLKPRKDGLSLNG